MPWGRSGQGIARLTSQTPVRNHAEPKENDRVGKSAGTLEQPERPSAAGFSFAIIAARFNGDLTALLAEGAARTLGAHGAGSECVRLFHVPGSYEISLLASRLAATGRFDAIVCVGCVIRGETSHYDHLCDEVFRGLGEVSRRSGVPVTVGVVTAENLEQAQARAGGKAGNRGADAALAAIEMASLYRREGLRP